MADLKQLKIRRDDDFAEGDPLAELSRIMGVPKPGEEAEFDDFGIDLERELLGEFEQDEPAESSSRVMAFPERAPAPAPADDAADLGADFEAELEAEFSAAFGGQDAADEPAVEPYADPGPEPEPDAAAQIDFEDYSRAAVDMDFGGPAAEQPRHAASAAGGGGDDAVRAEPAGREAEKVVDTRAPMEAAAPQPAAVPEVPAAAQRAEDFDPFAELAAMAKRSTDQLAASQGKAADDEPVAKEPVGVASQEASKPLITMDDLEPFDLDAASKANAPEFEAVDEQGLEMPVDKDQPQQAFADPFEDGEPATDAVGQIDGLTGERSDAAAAFVPQFEDDDAAPDAESKVFDAQEPEDIAHHGVADPEYLGETTPEGTHHGAAGSGEPDPVLDEIFAHGAAFAATAPAAEKPDADELSADEVVIGDPAADDAAVGATDADVMSPPWSVSPIDEPVDAAPAEDEEAAPADDLLAGIEQMLHKPDAGFSGFGMDEPRALNEGGDAPVSLYDEDADDVADAAASPAVGWSDGPASRPGFSVAASDFDGLEFDTVEVPEAAVELSDDAGIPELAPDEQPPHLDLADELDLEFAAAYGDLDTRADAHQSPVWHRATDTAALSMRGSLPATGDDERAPAHAVVDDGSFEADLPGLDLPDDDGAADRAGATAMPATTGVDWSQDELALGDADDAAFAAAFEEVEAREAVAEEPRSGRRGLLIAALVAGVAIVGGASAFWLSWGSGDGETPPALVQADPSPVKVRPEQPGGVTVPNEDKIVYERVSGGAETEPPSQEKLLSSQEEPVDLGARTAGESPSDELAAAAPPKSEDRILPDADNGLPMVVAEEPALVTPRRVRTMIVKPDGTLVPREEPADAAPEAGAAEVAAAETAEVRQVLPGVSEPLPGTAEVPARLVPAAEEVAEAASAEPEVAAPVEEAAPAAEEAAPEPVEVASAPVEAEKPAPEPAAPAASEPVAEAAAPPPAESTTEAATPPVRKVETTTITRADVQKVPERGPVAPTRPSDQPVEIVGNTRAAAQGETRVAALEQTAPKPGEWSMQIASQPSPEAARESYVNLARRHGAILSGRGVNIVKADIAGKGTFWRVRVPVGTRGEATSLCERYKSAGGSCFVAR